MWEALIQDAGIRNDIQLKIDEITLSLLQEPEKNAPGLLDGNAGLCLYFAYLNAQQQTDKYNDTIGSLLESSFDEINEGRLTSSTFCSGISGVLWSMHLLNKEGFADIDDYFEELMPLLLKSADTEGELNNFDFLHGAGGITFYLSHMQKHTGPEYLSLFLKHLKTHAIEDEESVKWIGEIRSGEGMRKVFNLSLAHGISSTIIILCELLQLQPENKEIRSLIKKAVHFLSQQKETPASVNDSIFPNCAEKTATKENSRLSWCYGDIGNAIAILNAGKALNDQQLIDEAVRIMLHNSKRRDLKENYVTDAPICHGTAGLAHIFNRFYQSTHKEEFKDAAVYWLKKTLEMSVFEDGLAGYKTFEGKEGWQNQTALLSGVAGIGLVLISAISDTEPKWDRCFLLS